MSSKFIVSSLKDRFVYKMNSKIDVKEPCPFDNATDSESFRSIISDLFAVETLFQAYFEIITVENLSLPTIEILKAKVSEIQVDHIKFTPITQFVRNCVTVFAFMARRETKLNEYFEIRVMSAGNVDAGKSTLLGVLTSNSLDDGRGSSRSSMFNHKHEKETGRTSSICESIVSIDASGKIIGHSRPNPSKVERDTVPPNANKIINFFDLAGHEKYFKTTIHGLVGLMPDYIMLIIGSNMGLVGMCREHLGLSFALNIPIIFVLTKVDICPADVRKQTLDSLTRIIKSPLVGKKHINIRDEEDVVTAFVNLVSNRVYPIFQISCVTGEGLNLLKMLLSLLPPRQTYDPNGNPLFCIESVFDVQGVGCVASGFMLKGTITKNSNLVIGPFVDGKFLPLQIKSFHRKRRKVEGLSAGQTGSIALKKITSFDIEKGRVIISPVENPVAYWRFKAYITVLHHSTTFFPKYQATVHTGHVKQTASIVWMEAPLMRTGDKGHVIMQFIGRPEYLVADSTVVLREAKTKAMGVIKELIAAEPNDRATPPSSSSRKKPQKTKV